MTIPRSWYDKRWYARAKQLLFEFLYRSGLLAIFRFLHRDSVLVLTYHDILPPGFPEGDPLFGMTVSTAEFEWQLDYLCRRYSPINLQQFVDWISGVAPLPPRPLLLTFDDGHKNNVQFALPLLAKRRLPAVCFCLTAYLGQRSLTWVEEGYYRILHSPAVSWQMTSGESHPLTTPAERTAACTQFFRRFRTIAEDAQANEFENLRRQLPVEFDLGRFPGRFDFMDEHDLQQLRQSGIEIGAHTASHPILATVSEERSRMEMIGSKSRIEAATKADARAFAYPFGMPGIDFLPRDAAIAKQGGFSVAFAAHDGFARRASDPFAIPRFGIGRMSRAQFAATVSGVLTLLKRGFA